MATKQQDEYAALRAELLLLVDKATDVWKWSLVATVAIVSGVLLTVFGQSATILCIIKSKPWFLPGVLLLSAGGVVWVLATMLADLEETRDRLGGYLAVFHDQDLEPLSPAKMDLGYHIWNRIEQVTESAVKRSLLRHRRRFYAFSRRLWVYGVLVVAITLLAFALMTLLLNQWRWEALYIGVPLSLGIGAQLWWLGRRGQSGMLFWMHRWLELRRSDEEAFAAALRHCGLSTIAPYRRSAA